MPRPRKDRDTSRLNLELTKQTRDRLEELRERSEADSLTEVIRRALAVYDAVLEHYGTGGKVLLRDKDGVDRQVLVL